MSTPHAAARRRLPSLAHPGQHRLPQSLRWWVVACLISLLGFQSLGLVHRALHGSGVAPRVQLSAANPSPGPNLGHVAGSSDCQLLDQLSTALGPMTQALAWTALLPDHPVATPQPHSALIAQVWRLPARAPPLA